jgi:hypothetical protein
MTVVVHRDSPFAPALPAAVLLGLFVAALSATPATASDALTVGDARANYQAGKLQTARRQCLALISESADIEAYDLLKQINSCQRTGAALRAATARRDVELQRLSRMQAFRHERKAYPYFVETHLRQPARHGWIAAKIDAIKSSVRGEDKALVIALLRYRELSKKQARALILDGLAPDSGDYHYWLARYHEATAYKHKKDDQGISRQARASFLAAAELGDVRSILRLAALYSKGKGQNGHHDLLLSIKAHPATWSHLLPHAPVLRVELVTPENFNYLVMSAEALMDLRLAAIQDATAQSQFDIYERFIAAAQQAYQRTDPDAMEQAVRQYIEGGCVDRSLTAMPQAFAYGLLRQLDSRHHQLSSFPPSADELALYGQAAGTGDPLYMFAFARGLYHRAQRLQRIGRDADAAELLTQCEAAYRQCLELAPDVMARYALAFQTDPRLAPLQQTHSADVYVSGSYWINEAGNRGSTVAMRYYVANLQGPRGDAARFETFRDKLEEQRDPATLYQLSRHGNIDYLKAAAAHNIGDANYQLARHHLSTGDSDEALQCILAFFSKPIGEGGSVRYSLEPDDILRMATTDTTRRTLLLAYEKHLCKTQLSAARGVDAVADAYRSLMANPSAE